MFTRSSKNGCFVAVSGLLTILAGQCISSPAQECIDTKIHPLVSGLHFSVLDYQMWSNSNDTTIYSGHVFNENSAAEMLVSYEGRIGADHYRGWCSESNPTEQPFLQVDFKREVIIRQVETQGLLLNTANNPTRYIKGFWLAYSTNTATMLFINVTEPNSNFTKIFAGQDENNFTASLFQYLPDPITARIVRLYPNESMPEEMACVKLELHGCIPQRKEECQSVYPLSCCSYGQPGDIISNVEVTSEDPNDYVPGPIANILSYHDNTSFWCGNRSRDQLPANATFYFTEEVLLTSVTFHGLDGEFADDYVTQYSWEYSVGNSTFNTYIDLGNNTVFENNREDKFQQTFWTPIHVKTLKFVAVERNVRPCIAFQFFGCKLGEVISMPQTSAETPTPTMTSSIITSMPTIDSPTPSSEVQESTCVGDEEPLISGTHYYVTDSQLSASGHDPLHYTYSNMNERVFLKPEEGRIGNTYSSYLGWCSQIVTNMKNNAPYIQVDFGTHILVSAVAVQGFEINSDKRQPQYVKKFQLAYKNLESEEFCTINGNNDIPMNFTGNSNTSYLEIIKSSLHKPVRATVFRLYPISWESKAVVSQNVIDTGRACLKWELYGCAELKTKVDSSCYPNQTLLCDSDIVNITSNSRDAVVIPSLLHLADNDDHWCPSTAEIDLPLVITFSFSETVLLTSMAISGKKTINADLFVASYSLSYATDTSCNLKLYEDLFGGSVFHNNHVRTFVHSFWEPIHVRQLQLVVTDWHVTPCLSVGFFGCRSSEVNHNSAAVMVASSQSVCNIPTNNVLLSCVNEQTERSSSSDGGIDAITVVVILLSVCLTLLLVLMAVLLMYKKFKARLRFAKLRNQIYNTTASHMQSENPLYEPEQEATALVNDNTTERYSKLHHHRDDDTFSSGPYSTLQQQPTQNYAKEGPKESMTYEEVPYVEITSKPD